MTIELEFKQRPVDVPPDLRLYRRLGMLCLSMSENCRAGTASFRQIHFINSLYRDEEFRRLYLEFKAKKLSLKILSPSADPYLNRCVNYAIGAKLIKQKDIQSGFKIILTDTGKDFVSNLKKENLLQEIIGISKTIGRISEAEIQDAIRGQL